VPVAPGDRAIAEAVAGGTTATSLDPGRCEENAQRMDEKRAPIDRGPADDAVVDPARKPRRSRRQRIVRALGDIFLTAGIGRGISGGRGSEDVRGTTNVILFGEGDAKGRDANGGDRPD
jgi:hypothetical protein